VSSLQAEYEVRVQLLEIYNEQLRDLLDCSRSGKRLDIRNTERSGLNVPDATQVRICSPHWQLVSLSRAHISPAGRLSWLFNPWNSSLQGLTVEPSDTSWAHQSHFCISWLQCFMLQSLCVLLIEPATTVFQLRQDIALACRWM
jgi:hypothetical protein